MEATAGNPAMIASERERKIIQSTFKDNDPLLKSLRAVFLNLSPTEDEKEQVLKMPDEVKAIIRDRLMPMLDKNSPIGQVKDQWLGAEQMVFGASENAIFQSLQYKERALKLTEDALKLLDEDGPKVDLAYNPQGDHLGVGLLTRNQFIRHIESQLFALYVIANQKEEKPSAIARRTHKDGAQ